MSLYFRVLATLFGVALGNVALAADGDGCLFLTGAEVLHYTQPALGTQAQGSCKLLADGRNATDDADTIAISAASLQGFKTVSFSIGQCVGGCVTGNIDILESMSSVVGAPNVWNRIARLTGCLSTDVSLIDPGRSPLNFLMVDFPALGAGCTGTLGVNGLDIIATPIK